MIALASKPFPPCVDPEHDDTPKPGASSTLQAQRVSGARFGIQGKVCGHCYMRRNGRVVRGSEKAIAVARVVVQQSAPKPCSDPEHKQPKRATGRTGNPVFVKGLRFGIQGLICPTCYARRDSRGRRTMCPTGKRTARPCSPLLSAPSDPLPRHGSFGAMSPAQVSRVIRRLWGTPAAAAVLTRESEAWREV